MNATQRRDKIIKILSESEVPISATMLSKEFSVSRQVIVGDIALLRAFGADVFATPRGYLLRNVVETEGKLIKKIVCRHDATKLKEELYAIVDNGCAILDVIVEHPLYGELTGPLHIFSRYDVDEFIKKTEDYSAKPLSALTEGIHLHTISCPDEAAYKRVLNDLKQREILFQEFSRNNN